LAAKDEEEGDVELEEEEREGLFFVRLAELMSDKVKEIASAPVKPSSRKFALD